MASSTAHRRVRRSKRTKVGAVPKGAGITFDIRKYGGKWVATQRGSVVAFASTLAEIDRLLDEAGVGNDVVLTKVPRSGDLAL